MTLALSIFSPGCHRTRGARLNFLARGVVEFIGLARSIDRVLALHTGTAGVQSLRRKLCSTQMVPRLVLGWFSTRKKAERVFEFSGELRFSCSCRRERVGIVAVVDQLDHLVFCRIPVGADRISAVLHRDDLLAQQLAEHDDAAVSLA